MPGLRCTVFGIVQGVGFRFYTRARAQKAGLVGYVKNCPDGSVEAYAEGTRDQLEQFLADLRQGPAAAVVNGVDTEWRDKTGTFKDFQVTY